MNFDRLVDRKGSNCHKWDTRPDVKDIPDDLIPMWVADMDFEAPEVVIDAIVERLKHKIFGYTFPGHSYFKSVADWWEKRYGIRLNEEWIVPITGVIPGLATAVESFTSVNDGVIIQPPVYWPFRDVIELNRRAVIENNLLEENGYYTMDLDDLEKKVKFAKALILCNPHNPVGRAWRYEELSGMANVMQRSDLLVISDEIHADFVFSGKFVSSLKIESLHDRLVVLSSPNKTFNIPGIRNGYAIIPNEDIRQKFWRAVHAHSMRPNIFSMVVTEAVYSQGEKWLEELKEYIVENFKIVEREINGFKGIKVRFPEATFLMWIDFRNSGMKNPYVDILKKGVWLQDGKAFGTNGEGFLRMNVATPKKLLLKALRRIQEG